MRHFQRRLWHAPRVAKNAMDSEDAAMEGAAGAQAPSGSQPPPLSAQAARLLAARLDGWIAAMERLRLAEYVRYVDDRRRLFWSSFFSGVARGLGMAVGFTILGALLVLLLQDLAKRNLPLIGDVLAQIVSIVQKRLE